MRLSEIHTAIETGRGPVLLDEKPAYATLVAIEHLARIEGLPISALDFSAPKFGAKFRYHRAELSEFRNGRAHYLSWRKLILDAQIQFAPGDVDYDPWSSLRRAERVAAGRAYSTFYDLQSFLPTSVQPRDVADDLIEKTRQSLKGGQYLQFRAGVSQN